MLLGQPLENWFRASQRFLIAGAGGGFDFVCGLPLVLALRDRGYEAHLANLSFTSLKDVQNATWHLPTLLEVSAQSYGPTYFPEKWLCHWFQERELSREHIWCFAPSGVQTLRESYAYLKAHLKIDVIILVDGGVDSLLRGDEYSLGTPLWDAISVGAANSCSNGQGILVTTAFGAERWDKICHAQALARMADLEKDRALLGVESLIGYSQEGQLFKNAVEHIFQHQDSHRPSVVAGSMIAALCGEFGERSISSYTENTPLWISPLMNLYWYFNLSAVANQKQFLPLLMETATLTEAALVMEEWMKARKISLPESIPI